MNHHVLTPARPGSRSTADPSRIAALALAVLLALPGLSQAFCGFYVAKADAELWNQASQVAIARDGNRTVLTMANDYEGPLNEFAIVVPVPVVLQEDQIHVGDRAHLEHLDAYTAPRLVEYFDPDPCRSRALEDGIARSMAAPGAALGAAEEKRARALGVTIEARFTVGEYDILILSARESDGLETWLTENGYRLPRGASAALAPYIRQKLKFFVARVNLEEQARTGLTYLRPLQMAFESDRFMLPIRLGMLNAREAQDLIVYLLTREGRVETANYRTVRIPSDKEVPIFVKESFGEFYRAVFEQAWEREGRKVVFLEYFWDMGWCDPCAADPLSRDELLNLGAFWVDQDAGDSAAPPAPGIRRRPVPQHLANVLVTRLHLRYDDEHFPEDLVFQQTRDRQNFQGRYVLRHPFTGEMRCPAADEYRRQVIERREQEAQTAANLTGWSLDEVHKRMGSLPANLEVPEPTATPADPWWRRIWK